MKRKTAIVAGVISITIITGIAVVRMLRAPQLPFNDADLRTARVETPAQSNGIPFLLEAATRLAVSKDDESVLSALGTDSSWDEVQAKYLLKANAASLSNFHEACSYPHLQVPAVTNYDQEFPYLREWRQLSSLALIEARLSFHAGSESTAFERAMAVARFGQRVEESSGGTLHYLTGSSIKLRALERLRQFADQTKLPADELLSLSRQLNEFEANSEAIRHALKVEYVTLANVFDGLVVNVLTNSSGQAIAPPRFVYSATRSKAELAGQIRRTMAVMTNCYAIGISGIPVTRTNMSTLRWVLNGNAVGTMLNEMSVSSWRKLYARKCAENVAVRATRVVLALRTFQMTHARPARSLEELMPEFLDVIPTDDFDCQRIRYSPTLKVVYSVGDDLADSGGVKSTNRLNPGDLVFPFNF